MEKVAGPGGDFHALLPLWKSGRSLLYWMMGTSVAYFRRLQGAFWPVFGDFAGQAAGFG